jgi:hypothetical protein
MTQDQLRYRFNKIFFDSIKQDLGDQAFLDYAIAGGALRDSLVGEKVKDIDIFCANTGAVERLEAWFEKQEGVKIGHKSKQLSNYTLNGHWFQVIRQPIQNVWFDLSGTELIENFDFTICGIMMHNDEIRTLPTFFEDMLTKRLRNNKLLFPLNSFKRMQKYIKKGYVACDGTLLAVAQGLSTINYESPDENTLSFYPDGSPRFVGVD